MKLKTLDTRELEGVLIFGGILFIVFLLITLSFQTKQPLKYDIKKAQLNAHNACLENAGDNIQKLSICAFINKTSSNKYSQKKEL